MVIFTEIPVKFTEVLYCDYVIYELSNDLYNLNFKQLYWFHFEVTFRFVLCQLGFANIVVKW